MSKITSNTCIFIVTSFFFTLEKISKEVMYHIICVNYDAKIEAGPRAGAGPKSRLRLQPNIPAPGGSKTLYIVHFQNSFCQPRTHFEINYLLFLIRKSFCLLCTRTSPHFTKARYQTIN